MLDCEIIISIMVLYSIWLWSLLNNEMIDTTKLGDGDRNCYWIIEEMLEYVVDDFSIPYWKLLKVTMLFYSLRGND